MQYPAQTKVHTFCDSPGRAKAPRRQALKGQSTRQMAYVGTAKLITADAPSLVPAAPGPTVNKKVRMETEPSKKPAAAFHQPSLKNAKRHSQFLMKKSRGMGELK